MILISTGTVGTWELIQYSNSILNTVHNDVMLKKTTNTTHYATVFKTHSRYRCIVLVLVLCSRPCCTRVVFVQP